MYINQGHCSSFSPTAKILMDFNGRNSCHKFAFSQRFERFQDASTDVWWAPEVERSIVWWHSGHGNSPILDISWLKELQASAAIAIRSKWVSAAGWMPSEGPHEFLFNELVDAYFFRISYSATRWSAAVWDGLSFSMAFFRSSSCWGTQQFQPSSQRRTIQAWKLGNSRPMFNIVQCTFTRYYEDVLHRHLIWSKQNFNHQR